MRLVTVAWYDGYRWVLGFGWTSNDIESTRIHLSDVIADGGFLEKHKPFVIRLPRRFVLGYNNRVYSSKKAYHEAIRKAIENHDTTRGYLC